MRDRRGAGRRGGLKTRGEDKGTAKLTEDIVIRIRSGEFTGTRAEIGQQLGVSADCIDRILWGKTWKHLKRPTYKMPEWLDDC